MSTGGTSYDKRNNTMISYPVAIPRLFIFHLICVYSKTGKKTDYVIKTHRLRKHNLLINAKHCFLFSKVFLWPYKVMFHSEQIELSAVGIISLNIEAAENIRAISLITKERFRAIFTPGITFFAAIKFEFRKEFGFHSYKGMEMNHWKTLSGYIHSGLPSGLHSLERSVVLPFFSLVYWNLQESLNLW